MGFRTTHYYPPRWLIFLEKHESLGLHEGEPGYTVVCGGGGEENTDLNEL